MAYVYGGYGHNGGRRIEVQVSYGARMGIAIAVAVVIFLLSGCAIGSYVLSASDDASSPPAGPCVRVLDVKTSRTCTDSLTSSGRDYRLSPDASGTYIVSAVDPTGSAAMCVTIARNGSQLARDCRTAGSAVSTTAVLDTNTVDLRVEDMLSSKPHAVTLTITKKGAPNDGGGDARPFPVPLLALPALGLVFLIIPIVLLSEKKRIPRYIDPTGVTMRSGVHLPWQAFRGVRVLTEVTRSGTRHEVGVELLFATGAALIRYRPITNKPDVFFITEQLKQGRNPFA